MQKEANNQLILTNLFHDFTDLNWLELISSTDQIQGTKAFRKISSDR